MNIKSLLLPLLPLLLFPFFADASIISRPANNLGLVGYWSFNEGSGTKAFDYSGHGYFGTTTASWVAGKFGKALTFNGTSDYVGLTNASTTFQSITITAWIKPAGVQANWTGIVYARDSVEPIGIGYNAGSALSYTWNYGDIATYSWASGLSPANNTWDFVALTITSSAATMYLGNNGGSLSSATNAIAHSTQSPGTPFYIGWDATDAARHFNGVIDDVRIYNRALSATEVANLYAKTGAQKSVQASNKGLVGYWNFNEGSGSTAHDSSVNGNIGTLQTTATALPSWTSGKFSNALSFDGTTNNLLVPAAASITLGKVDFSYSLWMRTSTQSFATISAWRKNDSSATTIQGLFTINRGTAIPGDLGFETWAWSTVSTRASSTVAMNDNKWHNAVAVYTSSDDTVRFYVDGVLNDTKTQAGAAIDTSSPFALTIGSNTVSTQFFPGSIDDVRLYNRALSASEVAALYRSTAANTSSVNLQAGTTLGTGLLGLWTFDGPDVTDKVYDRSGQGNNGYVDATDSTSSMKTIGKLGQALKFNGSTTYVNAALSLSAGSPYSVAFWAKHSNPQTNVDPTFFSIPGSFPFILGFEPASNKLFYAGSTFFSANFSWLINSASWHHYSYVLNGTTISLYIDGAFQETLGFASPAISQIDIGDILSWHGSYNYSGAIDDVRVYNRALSASEVQKLYLMGK